ncbi:hypothetical protein [Halopelagius longus]|uniref:Uncharacterized protein n=1 Tax=Halopelagius longus TaxID=1236180 RepID=A0A1H1AXF2_9EURY|nr:hypothetical protein [Halopelagius longus]RDI70552.1 hypothetical protein DWB78_01780 [Halopelagius longus]SDQ44323.1 hypothetical protein SAMN05216278_1534 [Halopelagius longus]
MRDDSRYDDSRDDYGHDEMNDRSTSGSRLPVPTIPWGWAPASFRSGDDHVTGDEDHDTVAPETERYRDEGPNDDRLAGEGHDDRPSGNDGDSWLDEGLITLLIVGGALLFLFPEPATSAVGIVLLGIGIIAWVADIML